MKRIIALALTLLMILSCGAVAQAAVRPTYGTQDSDYFSYYGTTLAAIGNGQVDITFSCGGVGTVSQLGVSSYTVERYDADHGWINVSGLLSGEMKSNVGSFSFGKAFQGVSGEIYRVVCTFLCVRDGSSESKLYTSPSVKAK